MASSWKRLIGATGAALEKTSEQLLVGAFAVVFVGIFLALALLNPFQHLEDSTFDVFQRIRARTLIPSEDVVLLSMDHKTVEFARNNPELGIEGEVLPRRYVAKLLNYLIGQGVRAVVFDVEFKNAQGPENDAPLAEAIANAPKDKVFLAVRTDQNWELFYDSLYSKNVGNDYRFFDTPEGHRLRKPEFVGQIEQPRLMHYYIYGKGIVPGKRLFGVLRRLHGQALAGAMPLTIDRFGISHLDAKKEEKPSPFGPAPYDGAFDSQLNQFATQALVMPVWVSWGYAGVYDTDTVNNFLYAMYENDLCLKNNYHKFYNQKDPNYLQFLQSDGIHLSFQHQPDREARGSYTFCYTEIVHKPFRDPKAHIGITSVEYEKDNFDRKVPFLYRSYNGSLHTYLGLRPVIELLKPKKLALENDYLVFDHRKVPIVQNRFTYVNWRDPRNLVAYLENKGDQAFRLKHFRFATVARLNAQLPAPLRLTLSPLANCVFFPGSLITPSQITQDWIAMSRVYPWEVSSNSDFVWRRTTTGITEHERIAEQYFNREKLRIQQTSENQSNWWESFKTALHLDELHQIMLPDEDLGYMKSLGGGHLYRKISVADILSQIGLTGKHHEEQLAKLNKQYNGLLPYNYRLYENPSSGAFSFKDKIVVYGDTLTDVHRTPMGTVFGPEVIATSIDMFLNDEKFVRYTPWWATVVYVLALTAIISLTTVRFTDIPLYQLAGINFIFIMLYPLTGVWAFLQEAYYTPMILPLCWLLIMFVASILYRYKIQDKEKRMLTNVFGKYVSPQLMEEITKNPETAMDNLKGSKKELTVLFSDLRGFTSTFENEDPEVMVVQLNEYFDVMTNIILDNKGTYDKYMGDAIMAFFGAPAEFPDHALYACKAAIEMREALKDLNKKWVAEGKTELGLGVGLSTGQMFVGNFGSEKVKNFTVMGSTVNLGARLESYTRQAGMEIVISEATMQQANPYLITKDLGLISVKGFSEDVRAYGLEDLTAEAKVSLAIRQIHTSD